MKPHKLDIELKPSEHNPRKISPLELDQLAESLHEYGDLSGIVFNETEGTLISGHQRIKSILKDHGSYEIFITEELQKGEKIGYVMPGRHSFRSIQWDEVKAGQARIAANNAGGSNDSKKLAAELHRLKENGASLQHTGLRSREIQRPLGV